MSRDVKYIGMDVHKEATVIAVQSGGGRLVMESIVETKTSSILQFIHGLRGELHVTREEGTWAAWLYDLLKPQVHRQLVCCFSASKVTPHVLGSLAPRGSALPLRKAMLESSHSQHPFECNDGHPARDHLRVRHKARPLSWQGAIAASGLERRRFPPSRSNLQSSHYGESLSVTERTFTARPVRVFPWCCKKRLALVSPRCKGQLRLAASFR